MEHYTPPDLDPVLQSFHDVYMNVDPDNDLDTFECLRQGLRYCIHNNVEPDQAIIDLSECKPFVNVSP